MSVPNLYPLNDFAHKVTFFQVVSPSPVPVALETGVATAHIGLSDALDGDPADVTLTGTVIYSGENGEWLVTIADTVLDPDLLRTLFSDASVPPYLHVRHESGIRIAIKCKYHASRVVVPA